MRIYVCIFVRMSKRIYNIYEFLQMYEVMCVFMYTLASYHHTLSLKNWGADHFHKRDIYTYTFVCVMCMCRIIFVYVFVYGYNYTCLYVRVIMQLGCWAGTLCTLSKLEDCPIYIYIHTYLFIYTYISMYISIYIYIYTGWKVPFSEQSRSRFREAASLYKYSSHPACVCHDSTHAQWHTDDPALYIYIYICICKYIHVYLYMYIEFDLPYIYIFFLYIYI